MARIFIVSEFGAGYGHIAKALLLARVCGERGHEVFGAVKNLDVKATGKRMRILSVPGWPPGVTRPGAAVSYAEILARRGYCLPGRLADMLRQWLRLLDEAAPDLVLADFAPTAVLAARIRGLPCAGIGTGFQAPPATVPYPPLLAEDGREGQRRQIEALVLGSVRRAFAGLGGPPPATLQAVLAPDRNFLCTFAECDHYPQRGKADYLGPLFAPSENGSLAGLFDGGEGIFCYLGAGMAGLDVLCTVLRDTELPVLLHVRGLPAAEARRLAAGRLEFTNRPLDMARVAARSRLVVTHGGHGATCAALLAGCPVLLVPQQVEQLMFARRLAAQGLGLIAPAEASSERWRGMLREALDTPAPAVAAFAARHRGYDPLAGVTRIVTAAETVLARHP